MLKQLVSRIRTTPDSHVACQKVGALNENSEIWATNPFDALRVDILSSERTSAPLDIPENVTPMRDLKSLEPLKDENSLVDSVKRLDEQCDADSFSVRAVNHIISKLDGEANDVTPSSVGIFSDSKIYSAMIKHEIKHYNIHVKHFNHPNTFSERHFPLFDTISAWIVFLSEDSSEESSDDFIDQFLDRYVEKPTLFLFEKTNRLSTTAKIKQFAIDNGLIAEG